MEAEPIIRVRDLETRFGSQVIHQGLDLDVRRGEVLGVVGGSGTGKSVLLKAIVGLLRPAAGSIEIFGQEIRRLPEERRRAVERRWGVMFQGGALFTSLTVGENVQVPVKEHLSLPAALALDIAVLKIRLAGLPEEAASKYPAQLSGGMKKRAALARAMALDAELLFLDEPTSGLDPIGAAAFDELILSLSRSLGLTVFMVTHDLDSLVRICDRIAVLADERILAIGPLEEILRCDHPWVHSYFHGPRGRSALGGREA